MTDAGNRRSAGAEGTVASIVGSMALGPDAEFKQPTVADLSVVLTGRLAIVEPLAARHEAGLIDAATDAAMFEWMPVDMTSVDALRRWLETTLESARAGREIPFALRDARSGAVVGSTRFLELRFEHLRAEIGWTWLARPSWSTGINVESKLMLLDRAFEYAGLRRVEFKTDARNERSRGALTALGTHFEGIFRKHMLTPDGGVRDSAYYAVTDDEWPAVRQHLLNRLAAKS